ncbi:capsular polysaccharide synthesis protein [Agrobacterium rosae]|uniref:capsular polysaccharide synthesis protein n=1 Tax=Agrobacterium rosae TaxID=1972867 RepID=UPI00122F38C1|nr:capsular polysaccharide synthesis protein [Agrobacterium rosae]KAA3507678.1 hypothetical protein DXM21_24475 [Agrobacterium rosae]KAA3512558.1 hypothetical protein DXM25_24665 [Agrobacterium rosae]MQB51263.1 hypothetical protein [Agrobacterium rosae]
MKHTPDSSRLAGGSSPQVLALIAQSRLLPWQIRRKAIASMMSFASDCNLEERRSVIDHCKSFGPSQNKSGEIGPIWQFWAQGAENAPPLVKTCLRSVESSAGNRKRILLTNDNIADYLDIPGDLMDRIPFWGLTKFSNLLRLMLLEKYGGTWIDATVLIDKAIPTWIENRSLFFYRWPNNPRILATWFMHAFSGHPLIGAISTAYQDYWRNTQVQLDYFMFHYLIEAVVLSRADLSHAFKDVPFHDAMIPHELQWRLAWPFNKEEYQAILSTSPIQKLTYKIDGVRKDVPTYLSVLTSEFLT